MLHTRFVAALLLVMALAMVFVMLNPHQVDIELALLRWQVTLGVALIVAFALGLLVGVMVRSAWIVGLLSERGRLRRALKAAEAKARSYAAGEPFAVAHTGEDASSKFN